MSFRISVVALAATLALTTACTNKKVNNPLAKVDSKQPDKVLFDRGMDAMKHNHFDVARLDMQTLINTYPDSEFIARAKLALADSWYAEGGTAALAQAEQEYSDFKTFFPNMPEAAEAQVKIANIHFQQMEKPDRDYTHAMRAEEEYRQVILQYPDNRQMVAEARKKLLQVQEVIAEREYRIGRFYYLRQSFPAAIARLQTLIDRYPLYSKADETLFLLGQSYEGEVEALRRMDVMERARKMNPAQLKADELARERMSTDFVNKAADAYSKILTRYPVMVRSDDAKARLIALHKDVPRPTKAALAQNKAEEDGRGEQTMLSKAMSTISRHPDTSSAAKLGDPSLNTPTPVSATGIVQAANKVAIGAKGSESLSATTINGVGAPPENQPAPRSDAPPAADVPPVDSSAPPPDPNELKPASTDAAADAKVATAPDPNELKPNVAPDAPPAQAPAQVNEITQGSGGGVATDDSSKASSSHQDLADDNAIASSKHKKKKGIRKIIPLN